jgi:hypothetical protein
VELDEFIQQYMRASQTWLTIGLQSPHQLDDQLRQTVLSLGTYLIGQAATMDGARLLADALYLRDPYWVKHWRAVWGRPRGPLEVIAEEPEFMPLEEQTELFANWIRRLKQYQFLLRPAVSEGTISTNVYPIDISPATTNPMTGELSFPDRELIGEFRSMLAAKTGRPVQELLQEQERSLARYTQVVEGRLRRPVPITRRAPHTNRTGDPRTDSTQPESGTPAADSHHAGAIPPVTRRVRIA